MVVSRANWERRGEVAETLRETSPTPQPARRELTLAALLSVICPWGAGMPTFSGQRLWPFWPNKQVSLHFVLDCIRSSLLYLVPGSKGVTKPVLMVLHRDSSALINQRQRECQMQPRHPCSEVTASDLVPLCTRGIATCGSRATLLESDSQPSWQHLNLSSLC